MANYNQDNLDKLSGNNSFLENNHLENSRAQEQSPVLENVSGLSDFAETLQTVEGVETQRVSETRETASENKAGSKAQTQDQSQLTPAQLRVKLLANCPSEKLMKVQIRTVINKDLKVLTKKMKKFRNNVSMAFELTQLVAKMRELQRLLQEAMYATFEVLQNIWLKVVHKLG